MAEPADISPVEKGMRSIRAMDIMSRYAITIPREASVSDAAHLMMRFKISGIPVIGPGGRIAGIVTATDLFRILGRMVEDIEKGFYPTDCATITVESVMISDVHTVEETTPLFDIVKLMCSRNIHTLPVLKDGDLVGVVGRRDVLHACYSIGRRS